MSKKKSGVYTEDIWMSLNANQTTGEFAPSAERLHLPPLKP
jgi:hypothetical protein